MLYKVVLTFEATMKYPSVVIHLEATEQYLQHAVLFIKLMNENVLLIQTFVCIFFTVKAGEQLPARVFVWL